MGKQASNDQERRNGTLVGEIGGEERRLGFMSRREIWLEE